jgi:hypothetical protein
MVSPYPSSEVRTKSIEENRTGLYLHSHSYTTTLKKRSIFCFHQLHEIHIVMSVFGGLSGTSSFLTKTFYSIETTNASGNTVI